MAYDATRDKHAGTLLNFGVKARALALSDTEDLASYPRAVMTLSAGDVKVIPLEQEDDTPVTFVGLPAGKTLDIRVRRIFSTGTTATVVSNDLK